MENTIALNALDLQYDKQAWVLAKRLDAQKQEQFVLEYAGQKKNWLTAVILWWILGIFAGHRFYLGNTSGGIWFLLSYFLIIVPLILLIMDLINMGKNVRAYNDRIASECFAHVSGSLV